MTAFQHALHKNVDRFPACPSVPWFGGGVERDGAASCLSLSLLPLVCTLRATCFLGDGAKGPEEQLDVVHPSAPGTGEQRGWRESSGRAPLRSSQEEMKLRGLDARRG